MSPTPRRKWYLTTGVGLIKWYSTPSPNLFPYIFLGLDPSPPPLLVVFICFSWFMCVSCATWCPLVLSCRWVIHTTFIRVSCWMWVCFVVYVRDVMSPCIVVSVGDTHNIYTCVVLNVCVFRGLCSWRDVHLYCRVGGWYTQTHSHVCSVECMCVSWCMFVTWLICLSWFIYVCFLVCVCFIWLICLSCCMCVSCVFPDLTHSS